MAIGPTGLPVLPPIDGQRSPVGDTSDRRADTRAARGGAEPRLETVFAEPIDDAERRRFDLERTADQVRQLNPDAPRGTILNILV